MKYLLKIAAAALLLGAGAGPAHAKVDVVAATQDLAWVTRTVGGSNVSVDYLASSSQDPHRVDPRPSQVAKIGRADAVVRVGLDLDLWFDPLIREAANSKVTSSGKGYIDASRGIRLLEIPSGKLDPSKGDIHIYGNPHYFYGPSNLPRVADNIRDGLKRVDPSNGATYDANYNALAGRLNEALKGWRAKLAGDRGKKVVCYHKSLVYFLVEFGLTEFANVEPRPGLEPSTGHVSGVATRMKSEGVKVILSESWRPDRFASLLARLSGGVVVKVPGGIGGEKGMDDYFTFMDAWVDRVSAAL
jgi:zinc/manganese transport system substrate-binding protein